MREHERAIRDFDRALVLEPGLVVAWRQRALAYRGKGDYERALADFEQAILLAPSDARLYTDRAVTYEFLGDYPNAIRDFNRAIALKPNFATSDRRPGSHLLLSGQLRAIGVRSSARLGTRHRRRIRCAVAASGASATPTGRQRRLRRARRARRQRQMARAAGSVHVGAPACRLVARPRRGGGGQRSEPALRRRLLPRRGGSLRGRGIARCVAVRRDAHDVPKRAQRAQGRRRRATADGADAPTDRSARLGERSGGRHISLGPVEQ